MPVALLAAVLVAAAPQQQLRAAELEDVSSRIQGSDWPACPQLVPPARNSAWSRLAAQILGAATGVKSDVGALGGWSPQCPDEIGFDCVPSGAAADKATEVCALLWVELLASLRRTARLLCIARRSCSSRTGSRDRLITPGCKSYRAVSSAPLRRSVFIDAAGVRAPSWKDCGFTRKALQISLQTDSIWRRRCN